MALSIQRPRVCGTTVHLDVTREDVRFGSFGSQTNHPIARALRRLGLTHVSVGRRFVCAIDTDGRPIMAYLDLDSDYLPLLSLAFRDAAEDA